MIAQIAATAAIDHPVVPMVIALHVVPMVIAQRAPMLIVVPVATAMHLPVLEPVQIVVLVAMAIAQHALVAKQAAATVDLAQTSLLHPSWRSVQSQSVSSQAERTAPPCSPICPRLSAPWPSAPCRVEFLPCVKPFKSKTLVLRLRAKKKFQPPV